MKKYLKDMPYLVKEYNFDKNVGIDFENLTEGSGKKVWWICSKGHEWKANIYYRAKGIGCPYCSNKKVCKDNCLATTHPELSKEWSINNKISPTEVTYGSKKKVWWKCQKGHEWESCIFNRSKGIGCPYCSNFKACLDNCFFITHPNLLKLWNYSKNKISPTEITKGSDKKAWWKCSKGHEWKVSVKHISNGHKCPFCSGNKTCKDNCIDVLAPNLVADFSNKNKKKSFNINAYSNKKVLWKCKKCRWEWSASPNKRTTGQGCPKCNESKGEKIVSQILDELHIKHKREYKFKELGQKRFDFALFKKHKRKPYAIIEYHGKQHYEPTRINGMSKLRAENKFKTTKKNDKIKKQYCIDNNIKYLEIPYSEKDNAEKLIRKFIYDS